MGYDFSAVGRDEPAFRLGPGWMALLLDVLNVAGVIDVDAVEPDLPAEVEATWDDTPTEEWPLDGPLSDEARAYFGFRSENAGQIPVRKLADNSPWIIAAEECEILAGIVDDLIEGRQLLAFTEVGTRVLERHGVDRTEWTDTIHGMLGRFGRFCHECAVRDGFWAY